MALANITNNVLTDSGTNLSSLATQTYVTTAISNLVASAPSTLDTLNELATALGNDANFATTVSTSIGNRVPYTGATSDVNIGVYNLAGGNVNINGGGSGGGALRLKQFGSSEANLEGYNSISTLTSGVFYFTSSASVPNFKNFVLNPSGLTDNTLRTYTLPDASGTLALTSNLSSYLPLAGGTLTGSLVVPSPFTIKDTNPYIQWQTSSGTRLGYIQHATNLVMSADTGSIILTTTSGNFTITSAGSSTFNNTVTATGFYSTTGSNFATSSGRVGVGTTTPADKFVVSNSGAEGIEFGFDTGIPYLFGYNRSTSAYKPIAFVGSGNVIITQGTIVDNGSKLQVTGAATFSPSGASGIILAADSSDANNSGRLFFMRTGGEGFVIMNNAGNLSFRSNSVPGNTSGNERMKLDSSYNLILNNGLTVTNTATLGSALINTSTLWNNEKLGVQISNSAGWSTVPSIMRLTNYISGGVTKITFTDSSIIDGWFGMVPVSGGSYFAMGFSGYVEQGFKLYQNGNSVFSGNVLPVSDAVYTLGSPSFRWNHVYTTDLHLSNEGKQNIVDGTWGDWTLQEGENDIFMLNNRSGEKFKIKLEKV
jgi:hypothetical protein